jgi:hypothetical protein
MRARFTFLGQYDKSRGTLRGCGALALLQRQRVGRLTLAFDTAYLDQHRQLLDDLASRPVIPPPFRSSTGDRSASWRSR